MRTPLPFLSAVVRVIAVEPQGGQRGEGVVRGITSVSAVHKVNVRVPGGGGRSRLSNGESA